MCCGYLNDEGDLVSLSLHPCYAAGDEELERISKLPEVTEVTLSADLVTDDGLVHLESMSNLQSIRFFEVKRISDAAWAKLRERRPMLRIALK